MRLWTFQSLEAATVIKNSSTYRADYSFPAPGANRTFYEWMARQMALRGISTDGHPPVWAWRPGGKIIRSPRISTARALLSDADLLHGIEIIEFVAPDNVVLLSSYSQWCEIYFEPASNLPAQSTPALFEVDVLNDNDDIQACVPFIRQEWVVDIRRLELKPGDDIDTQRCV